MNKQFLKGFVKAEKGSNEFSVIASTAVIDRQGESIDQKGWDLANFLKNPVMLWAHQYDMLPVGIAEKTEVTEQGLMMSGRFADAEANPMADNVRKLYEDGILRTVSVGFIPKERNGNIITKAELLEVSFVPVPANPEALSLAMTKGFDDNLMKQLQENLEKSVVPYTDHGQAPKDKDWDASKVQEEVWADGNNLANYKAIHAWYDAENADLKGSYKLPHHDTDLKANWRGVTTAMAALLGARGGVDIPDDEKKAVYNHLAKHYAEFDEEPPEFALKATKPSVCEPGSPDYDPEACGALFCNPNSPQYNQEFCDLMKAMQEKAFKSGRVLSEKNVSLIKQSIAVLQDLLAASEPAPKSGGDNQRSESKDGQVVIPQSVLKEIQSHQRVADKHNELANSILKRVLTRQ
jgi:HK97 family phage prohead protease